MMDKCSFRLFIHCGKCGRTLTAEEIRNGRTMCGKCSKEANDEHFEDIDCLG